MEKAVPVKQPEVTTPLLNRKLSDVLASGAVPIPQLILLIAQYATPFVGMRVFFRVNRSQLLGCG